MKKTIITILVAIISMTASAKLVTVKLALNPGMNCENCENRIKSNLRFEKGVKKIATSLADQVVTITYDDQKTTQANLIKTLKKFGYSATVANGRNKPAQTACAEGKSCDGHHGNGHSHHNGKHSDCNNH